MKFIFFCLLFSFSQVFSVDYPAPNLTIQIPMRDGMQLPTDLYLPQEDAQNYPCILLRSPAGRRQDFFLGITAMVQAGYVVAIQETRSVLDKEGKSLPFIADGWGKLQDGYDTVEWLAASPYTNGKIGTWGISALGITQLLLAPTNPPHLKCQYIMVAAASLYHHGLFPGGKFLKNQAEKWLGLYARDSGVLSYISQRPYYNEFWQQLNACAVADRIHVPGMHVGGWYDTFLQGTLEGFTSRQYNGGEGAKGQQKLVIGPWTHFWPLNKKLGDFDVPLTGYQPPYDISPKVWFDYYLKDQKDGINKLPTVIYYVMGPFDGTPSSGNVWKTSDIWPVPSKETSLYLNADLSLQEMVKKEGKRSYQYDPCDLIPTLGGHNLFLESGPKDQSSIEKRSDILVFTSNVLTEDLEITGNVSAAIYLASEQVDTDIILRLCDVYPDGRSVLITEGVYRTGVMDYEKIAAKDYLSKNVREITIDLLPTSFVFAKEHAVRLSISSSNYPRYEKNLNIGVRDTCTGRFSKTQNTVYMSENHPSRLILPVIESK